MAKTAYIERSFRSESYNLIERANAIIAEYEAQGYDLTLRQLYYQMVARDIIPNNQRSYKNLGNLINDARLAGFIDWDSITDRTRNLRRLASWHDPASIMRDVVGQYRLDHWRGQSNRVEVWIEKDALVGVIAGVCAEMDVPYFSCRGYTSQSEMHVAAKRFEEYLDAGQNPVVVHLGDHDPSGIDMTRDIADRLALFTYRPVEVDRIALNMDQIDLYNPPPNPAKITDSRAEGYIAIHGRSSWELDALDPATLSDLIRDTILDLRDDDVLSEVLAEESEGRDKLRSIYQELSGK